MPDTSTLKPRRNGWPIAKRVLHWVLAISIVVALLAPKPEHSAGLLHVAAGSVALAAALVRIFWRVLGEVRPRLRDSFRMPVRRVKELGAKAFGGPALQLSRLLGFAFLALVPLAFGAAIFGLAAGGEESPALELHEALGSAIMYLAIGHAVLVGVFAILSRTNVLGMTLTWPGVASEGGARGAIGIVLGLIVSLAVLGYVWGPFDLPMRLDVLQAGEGGYGGHEHDD